MSEPIMKKVEELCADLKIELRGEDGQPYCCGERMNVRAGLMGPDYAECQKCGEIIGNVASPHINGGFILSDEWLTEHGDATWAEIEHRKDANP